MVQAVRSEPGFDEDLLDNRAAAAAHINLLPIPAAIVGGDPLEIVAANGAFRRAGLMGEGRQCGLLALLGSRITAFLHGRGVTTSFSWEHGGVIDGRQFDVTIARRDPRVPGCLISLVDRTAELRTASNARREMLTDSLTGLLNRAGFADHIEAAFETAGARTDRAAVLIVDLDRFNRINACLGGLTGDELLITAARRIKSALRGHDALARTGGDEFGVLLKVDNGIHDAVPVADRVRQALSEPFRLSEYEIKIDCSIGLAIGGAALKLPQDLIRNAQFAVKSAKASRQIEIYEPGVFAIERDRFGLETDLRRAIEAQALRLTYQPVVDLATGRIVSFEALTRWRTEVGELSPTQFIPVAEESGLIVPLGRWAIAEAVRTLADWRRRAPAAADVGVSINLSAIQFRQDDVVALLDDALRTNGIDGSALTLELTESSIIGDPERISGIMRALRQLGARIAMDDFGTGYSSLAYLQRLPIDILKIDRSFVTEMLRNRDKLAIVRAILSLAQALGKATTAEGIETIELAQTLSALGCDYGQGFVYAPPLESDEAFAAICARNH